MLGGEPVRRLRNYMKKKIIHQKVVYGSGLLELVVGYISFVYYLLNLKCGFFFW